MVSRSPRVSLPNRPGIPGNPQLTFTKWLLTAEHITDSFARPLMLVAFFIVLALLGVFESLYPWAHIVAFVLFVAVFMDALGKAWVRYKKPSPSDIKRRVEKASKLKHRPLDAIADHPVYANDEQNALWRAHIERSRGQLEKLRYPRWGLNLISRDPYALRYAFIILLAVGIWFSGSSFGTRLVESINPALGSSLHLFRPALDAWITPPEYTGLPPIMIATPAGPLNDKQVIEVPQGSNITAHLVEKSGEAPELRVNGQSIEFTSDHSDFGITAPIQSGDVISIHRGWRELGSWRVHVVPDGAPQIAFTEDPSASSQKSVKLSWQASDAYNVADVKLRVTPRESVPGLSDQPVDIQLAAPQTKDVKRVSYEDLTASPWAGLSVRMQLIATNAAGHTGTSEAVNFVLPERVFFNPLARALVLERKRLLQNPADETTHNETANVMAGMAASHMANRRNDPLVLMALRTGAVRLVLDRSAEAAMPVSNILWQTAMRIEEGGVGVAERNLRQAQKDLADALDRGADQAEVQQFLDRLHKALAQYIAQLSNFSAHQPAVNNDLEQALGEQTNMLTPQDLDRMLEHMRDLSASGERGAAMEELSKLQQLLENIHTGRPQLSQEQQKAVKLITALRELSRKQKGLMDDTFRESQNSAAKPDPKLAVQQQDLSRSLRSLLDSTNDDTATDDMTDSAQEMQSAQADLGRQNSRGAVNHQNGAMASLQKAIDRLAGELKASMFMMPRAGSPGKDSADPFGRSGFNGFARDDNSVQIPGRLQTRHVREILDELQRRAGDFERSKTERDYIDRLLKNF